MKVLLALFFGCVVIYFASMNWRMSVKAMFAIVVLEGALRKWFLPQASELIYFLKDFVLLGAYLNFFFFMPVQQRVRIPQQLIFIPIFLVTGWCTFQAFNPALGSLLIGILGLKAYLFYIPLMWMLPTLFPTQEDLYKFLRNHLLLILLTCTLGIAQFFSPPSSFLNVYAPGRAVDTATFGAGGLATVRVTGTFSYINSYTGYLIVCFGLLFPMLTVNQSLFWRSITVIELILVAVNSFMTGSRSLVFGECLFFASFILIRTFTQPRSNLRLIRQFAIPLTVTGISVLLGFSSAIDRFRRRVTTNKDVSERVSATLLEPIRFMQLKDLDGYGAGATHQGSLPLRRLLGLPPGELIPVFHEGELGRVALELGPIGFFLWYGLRLGIAICLFSVFWSVRQPFLRQLALTAFLIQMVQGVGFLVFHHTFAPYYWFLSGFIFLLPHLDRVEQLRQEQVLQIHGSPYLPGYHSP
ncbi:hypothetical protein BST81_08560 [Leptolyngbya sp. 'hensonii']|uniref:hypothetical protein n=1 Tax=Leptolyngbya sp. 'hensonii' TaxID=1922337 RepID=UPI00094FF5C2|nr:hypothetical protein [Leptolyngbya sp. 'hensonii']OLP18782.1 hypothetical protein BST81_08560 [Leptolyngbya sp. 'hensonii']